MQGSVQAILAELRRALHECYGLRLTQVLLFGSRARGDCHQDSDIDVLIVLRGAVQPAAEIERTGAVVSGLSLQHECVISCVFIGEDRFLRGDGPLLQNIRREAVPA